MTVSPGGGQSGTVLPVPGGRCEAGRLLLLPGGRRGWERRLERRNTGQERQEVQVRHTCLSVSLTLLPGGPTCLSYRPVFLSPGMCFLVLNSVGQSWRACACVCRARPWTTYAPTTGRRRGRPRRRPGTGRPRPPTWWRTASGPGRTGARSSSRTDGETQRQTHWITLQQF